MSRIAKYNIKDIKKWRSNILRVLSDQIKFKARLFPEISPHATVNT